MKNNEQSWFHWPYPNSPYMTLSFMEQKSLEQMSYSNVVFQDLFFHPKSPWSAVVTLSTSCLLLYWLYPRWKHQL